MTAVLKGVRVLDLGTMITAPLAGMMLADHGAEVIKVEPPNGDPFRSFRGGLYSPHFVAYNRGKRGLRLDLRQPQGREALLKLIDGADVLIENYRAGVMERLGLGAEVLQATNPRLIHCSITGFGGSGPYSGRPAYDTVGLALSGIASLLLDAEHPEACGPTIPDNVTGMYACYGILGALYERERSGKGRRVEVNMLESSIAFMPDPFVNYVRLDIDNDRLTRVAASHSFAFRCADGKLLAVHLSSQPKFWEAFVGVLERNDLIEDERFRTRDLRVRHYRELCQVLADAVAKRPRGEWMALLESADVPFAPVQTISEVIDDPQVKYLGTFYETQHAAEGRSLDIHRPVLIDGTRQEVAPAPVLGEHSAAVLAEIGYRDDDIERLRQASVI